MGRGPGVRALDCRPLMTTKDPGLAWLELEEATASAAYQEAAALEEEQDYSDALQSMERKYWEGYSDAIINAMAALYGPTPLPGEDGDE